MDLLHTPLTVARDVTDVVIDGEAVLMDAHSGTYFGLDEVGTAIWRLIREAATGTAIVDHLQQQFGVSRSILITDVERFIRELHARRLLASS